MKKKVLSLLIAFSLFGQQVFAANLRDFVTTTYPSRLNSDGLFCYEIVTGDKVPTTVTAEAGNSPSYSTGTAGIVTSNTNSFDYKVSLDMTAVKNAFNYLSILVRSEISGQGLDANFDGSAVTGNFVVDVAYDNGMNFTASNVALGQVDVTDSIFQITNIDENTPGLVKVSFDIKPNVTVSTLAADSNKALNNLYATLDDVTVNSPNVAYNVTAQLSSADVYLSDIVTADTLTDARYGTISFDSDSSSIAVKYVPTPTPVPPSGGGSSYIPPRAYTVVDDVKTEIDVTKEGSKYSVNVDDIADPVKEGYIFDGWYLDTGFTNPVEGTLNIKRTTYLYAKFVPVDESAPKGYTVIDGDKKQILVSATDGKYFITVDELDTPVKDGFAFDGWYLDPYFLSPANGTIEITEDTHLYAKLVSTSVPQGLIADHHIAYIYGYPDGEVKPNGLITREEVAAAFYRLLEPSYRATIETTEHKFPDVEADRWSNEEIATLANGGYIVGDENGNFNPAKPITRAEFVTLANKFEQLESIPETNYFSDITGHWAEEAILSATNGHHWITGYEDGTFRPDNKITRAEAMTIINHMLVRYCDISSDIAKQWPDLATTDWYYGDVIEATTEHDFEREADGWHEHWIKPGASEEETEPTEDNTADETTENADELTDETVAENTESDGQTAETAEESIDENALEENTDANSNDTADENAETSEDTTVTE